MCTDAGNRRFLLIPSYRYYGRLFRQSAFPGGGLGLTPAVQGRRFLTCSRLILKPPKQYVAKSGRLGATARQTLLGRRVRMYRPESHGFRSVARALGLRACRSFFFPASRPSKTTADRLLKKEVLRFFMPSAYTAGLLDGFCNKGSLQLCIH
ncbi:unnamed protein product [Symbiodinium sp. CCMP2456]|nr:unnamed protein product [Symbiodinium sp. CCMP2456]